MIATRILFPPLLVSMAIGMAQVTAAPTPTEPAAGQSELFDRLDANGDGRLTAAEIPAERRRLFARLVRTADADADQALSRDEFAVGLQPSRSEKPLVQKRSEAFFGADALRYLLLRMDTNGNSQIEPEEVPDDLRQPFEQLLRMRDQNKSGILEWDELTRGGLHLAPVARRWTDQQGIDVAAETAKLRRKLGPRAERFDWEPLPGDLFGDQREVRRLFNGLDRNGDKLLEAAEVPQPFQNRFEQLVRLADGDGDGRLDRPEFQAGASRLAELIDPAERAAGGVVGQMPDAADGDSMQMPAELP